MSAHRDHRLAHDERQTVSSLIGHLTTYGQYSPFEELYIDTTHSFYEAESEETADSLKDDAKDFLKRVTERIDEEIERAKAVLLPGSWAIVRKTTEEALLVGRLSWIANESQSLSSWHESLVLTCCSSRSLSRGEGLENA